MNWQFMCKFPFEREICIDSHSIFVVVLVCLLSITNHLPPSSFTNKMNLYILYGGPFSSYEPIQQYENRSKRLNKERRRVIYFAYANVFHHSTTNNKEEERKKHHTHSRIFHRKNSFNFIKLTRRTSLQ